MNIYLFMKKKKKKEGIPLTSRLFERMTRIRERIILKSLPRNSIQCRVFSYKDNLNQLTYIQLRFQWFHRLNFYLRIHENTRSPPVISIVIFQFGQHVEFFATSMARNELKTTKFFKRYISHKEQKILTLFDVANSILFLRFIRKKLKSPNSFYI